METKDIHKLLDAIAQSGLAEVSIETADIKLSVKRNSPTPAVVAAAPVALPALPAAAPAVAVAQAPAPAAPATPAPAAPSKNTAMIKSPMVGTFYASGKPGEPLFVNVGDEVKAGQTVCIVEAMKLFNEIESDLSGRILKVLVEDKSPVEFDQPLFEVELA
jgi:acetyl-CoA carboxylase biotin carboxyl carrier protein